MRFLKNNPGIFFAVQSYLLFLLTSLPVNMLFEMYTVQWYFADSVRRLILGVVGLALFVRLYQKEKWTKVVNFRRFKSALFAGLGIIVMPVYCTVILMLEVGEFADIGFAAAFSFLFCQPFATGFWEEITFRAFLTEGYFTRGDRTAKRRFGYALFSAVLFGLPHIINAESFGDGVYTFFDTAATGFALAAVYLHSHNILVPIILHFLYNIPVFAFYCVAEWNENILPVLTVDKYLKWVMMGIMLFWAILFVVRKDKDYERAV